DRSSSGPREQLDATRRARARRRLPRKTPGAPPTRRGPRGPSGHERRSIGPPTRPSAPRRPYHAPGGPPPADPDAPPAELLQLRRALLQQLTRDHQQLDLLRALEDVEDLGVAGPLLQ